MEPGTYILSNSHYEWDLARLKQRQKRLERLIELKAPQIIIENEERLVATAFDRILAWHLLMTCTWEIDIVTGEMTIHETTPEGRLWMAMLDCRDDSLESEEL